MARAERPKNRWRLCKLWKICQVFEGKSKKIEERRIKWKGKDEFDRLNWSDNEAWDRRQGIEFRQWRMPTGIYSKEGNGLGRVE